MPLIRVSSLGLLKPDERTQLANTVGQALNGSKTGTGTSHFWLGLSLAIQRGDVNVSLPVDDLFDEEKRSIHDWAAKRMISDAGSIAKVFAEIKAEFAKLMN
jgi:hypothetical protein